MRRQTSFLLGAATIVIAGLSCHKFRDFPLNKLCKIESMQAFTFYDSAVPRHFFYNEFDNPTRVAFDDSPGTGTPFYDFFYDDQQRLIKFASFESHYYTYNDDGLAVIDSIFGGYAGGDFRYEEKIFYDDAKRIIRTERTLYFPEDDPNFGEVVTVNYEYDSRGNLVKPGVTYDNQTNVHRTNKVWMFIDKDYSVNNPLPGPTHYNNVGLPLNNVAFLGNAAESVDYNCKLGDVKAD
jgi:hypothetical protein